MGRGTDVLLGAGLWGEGDAASIADWREPPSRGWKRKNPAEINWGKTFTPKGTRIDTLRLPRRKGGPTTSACVSWVQCPEAQEREEILLTKGSVCPGHGKFSMGAGGPKEQTRMPNDPRLLEVLARSMGRKGPYGARKSKVAPGNTGITACGNFHKRRETTIRRKAQQRRQGG